MLRHALPAVIAVLTSLVLAAPAAAQSTHAGTVNSTAVSAGGAAPSYSGPSSNTAASPDSGTWTMNSSRALMNMSGFTLTSEDTLTFVFGDSRDIVLLRVNAGAADVAGRVEAHIGSASGPTGGNVWVTDGSGVAFGTGALVDVGGLFATTAPVTDADFLDGDGNFSFGDAPAASPVTIQSGASITGQSSFVGFVAPVVSQAGSSTVQGNNGAVVEALYGSASSYALQTAAHGTTGLDVLALSPFAGESGSLNLEGTTSASDVFVTSYDSRSPAGFVLAGGLTARGAPPSSSGDVVLAAGGGISRASATDPMQPSSASEAVAQTVTWFQSAPQAAAVANRGIRARTAGPMFVQRPLTATNGDVRLEADGDLTVGSAATVAGAEVALSARGNFVNQGGSSALTASNHWVVYASDPATSFFGGLGSGQTALWNANIGTRTPSTVSGNRYVFRHQPTLTFKSLDAEKTYGQDASGSLTHSFSGLHPGVSGAFAADTAATAFSGAPALSSPGAAPSADVSGSPYPINVALGSLASPSGYALAFDSSGKLTVRCSSTASGANRCPADPDPGTPGGQDPPPSSPSSPGSPSTGPAQTTTTPPTDPTPPANDPGTGLTGRLSFAASVSPRGVFGLGGASTSCAAGSARPCAVTIEVTAPGKLVGAAAAKRVTIGKSKLSIAPGGRQVLQGKLSSRGLRALKKRKKLKVTVTVTVKDSAGQAKRKTMTATLRAPKKR